MTEVHSDVKPINGKKTLFLLGSDFWREVQGNPLRTFVICFLSMTLSTTDQALFAFAISGVMGEFGISLERIGDILFVSFLFASFGVVVAGIISDYVGRRLTLIILLVGSSTLVGLHALSPSVEVLTVLRALGFGLAAGLYLITNTLVIESAPARYRGVMAGLLQVSYPVGFFVAAMLSGLIVGEWGWRATFYPAFAIIPIAFMLGRMLHEPRRFKEVVEEVEQTPSSGPVSTLVKSRSLKHHLRELVHRNFRRRLTVCFIGSFMVSLAIGGTTYLFPSFMVLGRGFDESAATFLTGFSYAIGALGYVLASLVGEFALTRRNTLILWSWLGALTFLGTIWLTQSYWALLFGFGFSIMFFFGSEAVRMPLIGEIFPTRIRATATAVAGSLAVTTAWLVAPILITRGVPIFGWEMTFTFFTVVPLFLGGIILLALENYPSGMEVEEIAR